MKTKFLILLAGSMLFMASCDNDENIIPQTSDLTQEEATAIAIEAAEIDTDLDEVREFVGLAGASDLDGGRTRHRNGMSAAHIARHLETRWKFNSPDHGFDTEDWDTCADITIFYSQSQQIFSITLDFGEEGCEQDGHLIKGKVTQTWSRIENGFKHDVVFENLMRENGMIDGVYGYEAFWTNRGQELDSLSDELLTFNANESFDLTLSREDAFKKIAGGYGITLTREAYTIVDGKVEGSNSNNNSYTLEVIEPIVRYFSCDLRVPQQGVLFVQKNANSLTIDFGDGECDKLVTINAEFEIEL